MPARRLRRLPLSPSRPAARVPVAWVAASAALAALTSASSARAHSTAGEPRATPLQGLWSSLDGLIDSAGAITGTRITIEGDARVVRSDGLPDHATGAFPNSGNPNRIQAQDHLFRMTLKPALAAQPTWIKLGRFGVALNGIPFDPGAAEYWERNPRSGWQYEAMSGAIPLGLDQNHAHVQPNGAYHYHGIPQGLLAKLARKGQPTLVGYAADGFPVYVAGGAEKLSSSYRLRKGERSGGPGGRFDGTFVEDWEFVAGSGTLDECNGRSGATPEYPKGTYYYALTEGFPFIPRCVKGTPDRTFVHSGPGPGAGGGMGGPDGPGGFGRGRPPGRPPHGPPPGGPGGFGGGGFPPPPPFPGDDGPPPGEE